MHHHIWICDVIFIFIFLKGICDVMGLMSFSQAMFQKPCDNLPNWCIEIGLRWPILTGASYPPIQVSQNAGEEIHGDNNPNELISKIEAPILDHDV